MVDDMETQDINPEATSARPSNSQSEDNRPTPQIPNISAPLPPRLEADRLKSKPRDTYISQFYQQPVLTTLSGFSHVANLVRNPYELINNVDEFVRHTSNKSQRRSLNQSTIENYARTLNQNNISSPAPNSPIVQEMDTFIAHSSQDQSMCSIDDPQINQTKDGLVRRDTNSDEDSPTISDKIRIPIPALPAIDCSAKRGRLQPLTIEEYEATLRLNATDLELIERVFFGSMDGNQLRAALWPYLFGLVEHRGRFERIGSAEKESAWIFVEHEANNTRWASLNELYQAYQAQWRAIMPDQESRFSTFRERKSLIERDVIRCDRLHPFYAEKPRNLDSLTNLLMTYMMYDFDIGYVQGMSDLAGPILYMYNGDHVKAFWIFVEVMKLFRRNFELSQKTIHYQLECLNELVNVTDPVFAQYLKEHECDNYYFVFRAIVCQFKRELMKEDEDDYNNVLFLWDTIWCANRRQKLKDEQRALHEELDRHDAEVKGYIPKPMCDSDNAVDDNIIWASMDPNQSDTPRHSLTETEIFVLSLCLSMIRRERDIVMANNLDSTEIHLHFIDPKLATDINTFIEHGINIYHYLKNDFDIKRVTKPRSQLPQLREPNHDSSHGSAEGYDLLSDFDIIGATSA